MPASTSSEESVSASSAEGGGSRPHGRKGRGGRRADFLDLTKPRITFMVMVTAALGFILASANRTGVDAANGLDIWLLFHAVVGTGLVSAGAGALNHVVERRADALMRRTAHRPLPAGRLGIGEALAFAAVLAVAGVTYLVVFVNLLTAGLGLATLLAYVLVYTPLKRHTNLATIVGAVPGAVPPVMGCTAATGELGFLAAVLFGILFLWQMPHFLAIAWMYRQDYERGGFPMLTVNDEGGDRTLRQMVLYASALVPVSLLPTVAGYSGLTYFVGALLLGLVYLGSSLAFGAGQKVRAARRLLLVSVLYLPGVLALLLLDQMVG